jgi:cell division transport system permease protein
MQLRYVFTELAQGLRRNLSMHVAVVLTLFVSLTLAGVGWLLNLEAQKTEEHLGNSVTITAFLCNGKTQSENCVKGRPVTKAQESAIIKVVEANPEVSDYHVESQETAYEKAKEIYGKEVVEATSGPEALRKSIWINLEDPQEFEGITSALVGLDGVHGVQDRHEVLGKIFNTLDTLKKGAWGVSAFLVFAALLMVANTIRLAAFARRREIGIMRLVGASSLYISLPFLMEALVTALVGVALSAAALGGFMYFGVHQGLDPAIAFMPWIGFADYVQAVVLVAILGPLLTVIPTLVLTRKYLKV